MTDTSRVIPDEQVSDRALAPRSSLRTMGPAHTAEPRNYAAACRKGRRLGAAFLNEMAERDFSPALGQVIKTMIDRGRFGGVEIGFLSVIAEASIRTVRC